MSNHGGAWNDGIAFEGVPPYLGFDEVYSKRWRSHGVGLPFGNLSPAVSTGSQVFGKPGKFGQQPGENSVGHQGWNSEKAASASNQEPNQFERKDAACFGEAGRAEDAGARGTAGEPFTRLDHEEEFERAWTEASNTRVELPPVDINRVLAEYYCTNQPLRFTRTMLWDLEVKKAFRPDLYIPSVVAAGSSRYWRRRTAGDGSESESFLRCSQQRLWLEPSEQGLVLEQVFLNPAQQNATFIGAAELLDKDGNLLRAGRGQPIFHVQHSVGGDESRPINLWRIVYLTDRPERKLIERFTLAEEVWLREFVEVYIRRDLRIELTRRDIV